MDIPSFKEDHISQIPALQLLMKMGYEYLTPDEAMQLRGNKTTNVLLEDILRKQLKEINSIRVRSSKEARFTDANIENGINVLKELPTNEGYMVASEYAYYLLTLGKALEQNIDGDKKSFTLQYIDWHNPANNVFHVTEEFSVMRSGSREHYRPDIVLFINGIPVCIIECKRPDIKTPIARAISQHLRSQQDDGIRILYVYSQIVLSIATDFASYGTNGTPEKFWSIWEEKFKTEEELHKYYDTLNDLKNSHLLPEQKDKLFSGRFRYVRKHFDDLGSSPVTYTKQDTYLFSLCEPYRLLDLTFNYIIFENGEKKIARYQQFYAIKKSIEKIRNIEGGRRKGGVIWHTQGSGKSLTMVMLAQAIAMEKTIINPKIILVTDRVDLDTQITDVFRKCGMSVNNAPTGQGLVNLLESKSDAVVTTVINKFEAAVRKIRKPLESPDIFVLVDEGHRSQHGTFNLEMQKTLPNACFIAMTGTPLFKKDKNTAVKFGGIIDSYTVDQAVKDKAVVPLLYEGRYAVQQVNEKPLDTYFEMISEPISELQKTDLKRKFSRADQLNVADQKVYAIAWDISRHYRDNWQGRTPFKAQLVCQSKASAIRYKEFLDEIGIVTSEVLISPPDEREGEDSAYSKSNDKVRQFWHRMMNEHGNPKKYQENLINRFKNARHPEIIIVVDKLLTGFDEPKNSVMYITRKLQGHSLLQAIARVNRVHQDKEFGYIIDYYGVLGELDTALSLYSSFSDFDEDDLIGTLIDINEEIKKLPQKHSELWEIFKTIENKRDAEAYEQLLRDEAIRVVFYNKLSAFARTFKLALSSLQFYKETGEKEIDKYKKDLAMFLKLRLAVIERYSDSVDYKQYEGQIQKLIDTHIQSDEVKIITELVNIFDTEKFQSEIEKTVGQAARADKIASRTARHITEKMDEDPAFYKKFSELLKETIREYELHRLSEAMYLNRVTEIMNSVVTHTDSDIPESLKNKESAKAFYGVIMESFNTLIKDTTLRQAISSQAGLIIDELIRKAVLDESKPIVDWQYKSNITGKLHIDIGDYLIDEVRNKHHLEISFEETDEIAARCIDIAKIRYN